MERPRTSPHTYLTWSVTARAPALPPWQKSVWRANYTKLCNNWPRNLREGSLLAAPSMSAKRKLSSDLWLAMTNGCHANDSSIYENGSTVLCPEPWAGDCFEHSTEGWSLNGPKQMRSLMLVEYLCRNNVGTQTETQNFMRIKGHMLQTQD